MQLEGMDKTMSVDDNQATGGQHHWTRVQAVPDQYRPRLNAKPLERFSNCSHTYLAQKLP